MKLSEILDDDKDPLPLVLLKNLMAKGHVVRAWMWVTAKNKVEGVITSATFDWDKRINKHYIAIDVKRNDDVSPSRLSVQRWYPTQWGSMLLTNKYRKPGDWWLIDTEPDN